MNAHINRSATKKISLIALCSCFVTFLISCSQKEENTYSQNADLNPVGYHELSKIEYHEEDVREIRHEFGEGFNHSNNDSK